MSSNKPFFLTTAIDYVNNIPHIGTAYEKIGADVIARFKRLEGQEVFFLMGNDEHSINVKKEAQSRNLSPLDYCDQMAGQFQQIWKKLGISYDRFIRTTEKRHEQSVQALFKKIYDNGDIYPAKYHGLYCESCETFYHEKDLENGCCPQHGKEPEWIEEDNYFFALSRYSERLRKYIKENKILILPEIRKNEIINVIKGGLEDISISRSSFDWGIPLPIQPDHVVYVWFDALINYISAIGYGWDDEMFNRLWPADMHVIGKDITRFHCIIWPAMLLAAGLEIPRMVFGHGFVYLKGEKMSKTLGNVITPMDIADVYGPDALRYYLLRDTGFGKDGNFTWENFLERFNGDLANDFGNLLQRVTSMIHRYRSGSIPAPYYLEDADQALKESCLQLYPEVKACLEPSQGEINFHLALARTWETIRLGNKYIDQCAPWDLQKKGLQERLDTVLYCAAECMRFVGLVISPFLPFSADNLFEQLGIPDYAQPGRLTKELTWGRLPPQTAISEPKPLFPRIQAKKDKQPKAKTAATGKKTKKKEVQEEFKEVSFSQFQQLDLRVGKILQAERVPDTDKLINLVVDIGEERRIIAGIGKAYTPEALIGQTVVVVANLKPTRIRGNLSEGMILAAGNDQDLALTTAPESAEPGDKIS